MNIEETYLKGCFIVKPKIFKDTRGYFIESYNQKEFKKKTNLNITFIQDNESKSAKGVLRGLHFQKGDFAQAKLVRVVKGKVLDVVVDLRLNSETFGQHFSIELTGKNKTQLFVPRNFAHGFLVLEDDTIFNYKCDNFYNKSSESGIVYNDTNLNIDWKLKESQLIISEKDLSLPRFKDLKL